MTQKTLCACIWNDGAHAGQINWILVIKMHIKTWTLQAAEGGNVVNMAKLFITWKELHEINV